MIEFVSIDDIRPAKYNPRQIKQEQFEILQQSIKELGFCLPILVNKKNKVIIAGHQRTKAARSVGVESVPCCYVQSLGFGDEIKFNQLHNAIEFDKTATGSYLMDLPLREYVQVEPTLFDIKGQTAACVKEMGKLIVKYGNCLFAIVCNGQVIVGQNYIYACKLLNTKANVYRLEDSLYSAAKKYLNGKYGEYSYEHLERHTYVQGLAQLNRLGGELRKNKSSLYENLVFPYLRQKADSSVLDFGCGKAAYIDRVKRKYPDSLGIEFYNQNYSAIDVAKGNRMIDELVERVATKGAFDVVVCDSVLNSVDSPEAEKNVITCCNLFAKDKLFISGRSLEEVQTRLNNKHDRTTRLRAVEFLDKDNFSANYRKGNWYYQHFHSKDGAIKLIEKYGFKVTRFMRSATSWKIEADKVRDLSQEEYIAALNFEFDLPLPSGRTYNRQKHIIEACKRGGLLN